MPYCTRLMQVRPFPTNDGGAFRRYLYPAATGAHAFVAAPERAFLPSLPWLAIPIRPTGPREFAFSRPLGGRGGKLENMGRRRRPLG